MIKLKSCISERYGGAKKEVYIWYTQNIMLFVNKDKLPYYPKLQSLYIENPVLDIIHPLMYENIINGIKGANV